MEEKQIELINQINDERKMEAEYKKFMTTNGEVLSNAEHIFLRAINLGVSLERAIDIAVSYIEANIVK